ncbi:hypothetical protein PWT90_04372 [Aphanocladium album]|nr:hypothetical protein PWT90_04372 [Aphanocladium album]
MRLHLPILLGLCLGTASDAQFVSPPTDLTSATGYANITVRYKRVPPGICELNDKVKSFSGYADVATDQHIFFWFFEAREVDPEDAPLTVWIDGGPGSSSMIGLFEQLGPCRVDYFGNIYNNPYSWSRRSNLLFIDQPTQVGFSYSIPVPATRDPDSEEITVLDGPDCPASDKTCGTWPLPSADLTSNSTLSAAPNMWKTLQGFMGAFPQYSRNAFHLATDSYGGHYGPIFSDYFLKQNEKRAPGSREVNIQSLLIGNGWFDPLVQFQAYYEYAVHPGNTYDLRFYNTSMEKKLYHNLYDKGNCVDRLKQCAKSGDNDQCVDADSFCVTNVQSLLGLHTNRDEHDIRELNQDPFPYFFYPDYLNRGDVQAAIGAYTNFSISSSAASDAFASTGDDGREVGTIQALRDLLARGITVALYAGDADYDCNWLGLEKIANMVGVPDWNRAGYANLLAGDGQRHGQVRQTHKFSFTRFFDAGHEVPFYRPLASLEFFERVISGRDVSTGIIDTNKDVYYHTIGPMQSTHRQGNSTVQWQVSPSSLTYDTRTKKPGLPWTEPAEQKEAYLSFISLCRNGARNACIPTHAGFYHGYILLHMMCQLLQVNAPSVRGFLAASPLSSTQQAIVATMRKALRGLVRRDKSRSREIPISQESALLPSSAARADGAPAPAATDAAAPRASEAGTTPVEEPSVPESTISQSDATAEHNHNEASSTVHPIQQDVTDTVSEVLWSRAYAELAKLEPELVSDYERHIGSRHDGSENSASVQSILSNPDAVKDTVESLQEERKNKQWKYSIGSKDHKVRNQMEKLIKLLAFADGIVKQAVSTQPYAALAWSAVSVFLPLLSGSFTKETAMIKGFETIADLRLYWKNCEDVFLRTTSSVHYTSLTEPLSSVYSKMLEYEIRAICHLSKKQLSRAWDKLSGQEDWAAREKEILDLSSKCKEHVAPLQRVEIQQQFNIEMAKLDRICQTGAEVAETIKDENVKLKEETFLKHLESGATDYIGGMNFNPDPVEGTCQWFYNHESLQKWLESSGSEVFWITAGPGCGKSVLARSLVTNGHLASRTTEMDSATTYDAMLAYFFFKDEKEEKRTSMTSALSAMLHQIFTQNRNLIQQSYPAFAQAGDALTQSFDKLWNILIQAAQKVKGDIICVLDALDECTWKDRDYFFRCLYHLYGDERLSSSANLKFLITSRPYDDIERAFRSRAGIKYFRFDADDRHKEISGDIDLVIDSRMATFASEFDESDRKKIAERLKSRGTNTYLWLHLTLSLIEENPSEYSRHKNVEALLSDIPDELSRTYEKILTFRSSCWEDQTFKDWCELAVASYLGLKPLVGYLIWNGADLNEISHGYGTALHSAVAGEQPEIASFLISKGAKVDAPYFKTIGTPLEIAACLHQHIGLTKLLLANGASPLTECYHEGRRPRGCASITILARASISSKDIFYLLLASLVDITTPNAILSAASCSAVSESGPGCIAQTLNLLGDKQLAEIFNKANLTSLMSIDFISKRVLRLLFRKDPNYLLLTPAVLKSMSEIAGTGAVLQRLILNGQKPCQFIHQEVLEVIAEYYDSDTLKTFFEYSPGHCEIKNLLRFAIDNEKHCYTSVVMVMNIVEQEVMADEELQDSLLMQQIPRSYEQERATFCAFLQISKLTDRLKRLMVRAAVRCQHLSAYYDSRLSSDSLDFVLKRIGYIGIVDAAVLKHAAERYPRRTVQMLLTYSSGISMATEEFLEAAANNSDHGREVMELILEKYQSEAVITPKIVLAAALKDRNGVLSLLLETRPQQVKITVNILCEIEDREILKNIVRLKSDELCPIASAALYKMANLGRLNSSLVECLLTLCPPAWFELTEEMVLDLVEKFWESRSFWLSLINNFPDKFAITERLLATAASRYQGKVVLEILKDWKPSEFIITSWVLEKAAAGGCHGLTNLLICTGRKLNVAENLWHIASFRDAAKGYYLDMLQKLWKKAPVPEVPDARGRTALIAAVSWYEVQLAIVQFLLDETGANVHAVDGRGRSALYYAVQGQKLQLVQMLLEAGADANAADTDGETPISIVERDDIIRIRYMDRYTLLLVLRDEWFASFWVSSFGVDKNELDEC